MSNLTWTVFGIFTLGFWARSVRKTYDTWINIILRINFVVTSPRTFWWCIVDISKGKFNPPTSSDVTLLVVFENVVISRYFNRSFTRKSVGNPRGLVQVHYTYTRIHSECICMTHILYIYGKIFVTKSCRERDLPSQFTSLQHAYDGSHINLHISNISRYIRDFHLSQKKTTTNIKITTL